MTAAVDPVIATRFRRAGWWRDRTFLNDFDRQVHLCPHADAIVSYCTGTAEPPHRIRFGELGRIVNRFAAALIALDVQRGEVISVQLPNRWEFAALTLACARAGAVISPLVPIYRHRELRNMLARTRSRVCIVPKSFRGFDHAAMLRELQVELPELEHVFAIGGSFEERFLNRAWEDEIDLTDRAIGPDDIAELQFTSGTSGEPKGVQHTANTLWSATRVFLELYKATSADVAFMASTLAHQTGFLYGLILPITTGMKAVYQDVWHPEEFLRIADAEGVTWTMGATPFAIDAVAAQRNRPALPSTLRWFICGGAPVPPQLVRSAKQVLGVDLLSCWGMTENGITTTTLPGDDLERLSASDGFPVPWMQISIVDEHGREARIGEIGQLWVRGASQTLGYFERREFYEAALREGRVDDTPLSSVPWFSTGDLAERRQDGAIRIAGRSKDLVIRGGENIPVVEIEALLHAHPKVRECAIVGCPDERLGERACAFVIPEVMPPSLAELKRYLADRGTAKQFWPERLEIVAELPKTASGKIQKFKLRELLADR